MVAVVVKRQFGISTKLYQSQRLSRDHLLAIAARGFEVVEVAVAAGHFEPSSDAAIADLQQWLAEARLGLHAVAAPPPDGAQPWNAGELQPVEQAIYVARRLPYDVLVLPVGSPKSAAKAVERLADIAAPLGVTIGIDSRSKSMVPIQTLVSFTERCEARVGIALDCATAGKGIGKAGIADAIEMASEHLAAVRVPADSAVRGAAGYEMDWPSIMTTLQKVGYEGPFVVDLPPGATLDGAIRTREKMERWLTSI